MTASPADIVTVTLNPAIDETITLKRLLPGSVMRAQTVRFQPGGKGVNVAACLADGGFKVAAAGLLGKDNAQFFQDFFAQNSIEDRFLYIAGATRTNIKLVTPQETTDINMPGLAGPDTVLDRIRQWISGVASDYLILTGSLPPGCPDDFYADIVSCRQNRKARIIVDCSGKPLKAVLAGQARPFCLKPNRDELAEWAGKPLKTLESVLAEARQLHKDGITLVAVSLGQEGAVFVSDEGAVHAVIELGPVESTVGAGDAMVAGMTAALSEGANLAGIAQKATAWAAGKLEWQQPGLPTPARLAELAHKTRCALLR